MLQSTGSTHWKSEKTGINDSSKVDILCSGKCGSTPFSLDNINKLDHWVQLRYHNLKNMFPTLIYQLNININSHKVWDKDQILFCLKWYNSYKYQYYNIFFHHANYVIQQDKCLKISWVTFVLYQVTYFHSGVSFSPY